MKERQASTQINGPILSIQAEILTSDLHGSNPSDFNASKGLLILYFNEE